MNIKYDDWEVRSVCSGCGYNVESPFVGNAWFTNEEFPVCPKCGKHKSFESKAMRKKYTLVEGKGFWKWLNHWEESWELK
jgi:NAD-dependent SIR2 family protein deacetylase